MVNLRLIREPHGIDSTFGVLFIDGFYHSHALENTRKIIPAGTYEIQFYPSPKFKRLVPLLLNVPNRAMIEIHIANWYYQLEGCIAPGFVRQEIGLLNSTPAFNLLMDKIRGKEVRIKIEEWA